jgi:hypothetical protein
MSLLELALSICLDSWRNLFVNPLDSCKMKWPESGFIYDIIIKSKGKLQIRDIKGICLCMLGADSSISAIDWLKMLYKINDTYSSDEYFTLIAEVCSEIPENQKMTIEGWLDTLSYDTSQYLNWLYALHNRISPSESFLALIIEFLKEKIINPLTVELICKFNLTTIVKDLTEALKREVIYVYTTKNVLEKEYLYTNFPKWIMAIGTFPEVAEMIYNLTKYHSIQAALCEIDDATGPGTLPQKYLELILDNPKIIVRASIQVSCLEFLLKTTMKN